MGARLWRNWDVLVRSFRMTLGKVGDAEGFERERSHALIYLCLAPE